MPANSKYTREFLEPLVRKHCSVSGVLRELGLRQMGGIHTHLSRRIRKLGLDTSHFRKEASNFGEKHKGGSDKKTWQQVLVLSVGDRRESAVRLRRALIEMGRPYLCEGCRNPPEWEGKELRLHVDHIDGNWLDNRPENLRFLCPNCHSQTPTYCNNKGGTELLSDAAGSRSRRKRRGAETGRTDWV